MLKFVPRFIVNDVMRKLPSAGAPMHLGYFDCMVGFSRNVPSKTALFVFIIIVLF